MRRQVVQTCSRLLVRELAADASAAPARLSQQFGVCTASRFPALGASALRVAAAAPAHGFAATAPPSRHSSTSSTSDDEDEWRAMNTEVIYPEVELEIGSKAPAFSTPGIVNGEIVDSIRLSDYKGKHVVLFWYPKDWTYVCPTEIIAFNDRAAEFEALNTQLIAASTDTAEVHLSWIKASRKRGGLGSMQIPMLADVTKSVAARYGVLLKDAGIALRGLFIIDDKGVVQHATVNNLGIGRSVDETLRTLQAVQFVAEHGEVCPAGWKPGDKGMVADPEQALEYFESAASSQEKAAEAPGPALRVVADKRDFEALVKEGGKVVVEFWAPWCGKCKQLAPFVNDLALRHAPGVTIASVDTTDEKLEGLTVELGVKGLPAFRFYNLGKEAGATVIGYKKQKLDAAVEELAKA